MEAKEVIERLCELQAEVWERLSYDGAADCFCQQSGFWDADGYDGSFSGGYRNDGKAIEFIEQAVHEKLAAMPPNAELRGASND
jgi:hypothetical protein